MVNLKDYRIVIPTAPTYNERRAADFIVSCVKIVAGYKLPVVYDTESPVARELVIGRTSREKLDGIFFDRRAEREWEGEIKAVGERIYLTGLGVNTENTAVPFSKIAYLTDGAYGAIFSAYRFVENVVGYKFVYAAHEEFPMRENIEFEPDEIAIELTGKRLANEIPCKKDGCCLYSIPSTDLNRSIQSIVIKSVSEKLTVIDGGSAEDAEHLMDILNALSENEVTTVSAWFITALKPDRVGALSKLLSLKKVNIEKIYHSLMPREFYTDTATDKSGNYAPLFDSLTSSDKLIRLEQNDRIHIDGIDISAVHVSTSDAICINDSSTVLRIVTPSGKRIMLYGNAGAITDKSLLGYSKEELKSDVIILGNEGAQSISLRSASLIEAKEALFSVLDREWYGEKGEGLYTTNIPIIRARAALIYAGADTQNIYRNTHGIFRLSL